MEDWTRKRGYRHIVSAPTNLKWLRDYVLNKECVSRHAFLPLIYNVIKQRRYKLVGNGKRSHRSINSARIKQSNAKLRPIHYACHLDAAIMAYYSEILVSKYETILKANSSLNSSIIAYRRIPIAGSDKNKGSIHFAKEVFDNIEKLVNIHGSVGVLMLDVKDFFNGLNYDIIKKKWCELLGVEILPEDHYSVFRFCTRIRYMNLTDIKKIDNKIGIGFNEKRLFKLQSKYGNNSFFGSMVEFREAVRNGQIKVYKNPFKGKGIPQGLPISSTISNMYMLDFDRAIVERIADLNFGFYRRYSDDIVIVCPVSDLESLEKFSNNEIDKVGLNLNDSKTEKFSFERTESGIICNEFRDGVKKNGRSLRYLGFEYNGRTVLIKSANLAKFYRNGITLIKRKSKQAFKAGEKYDRPPVLFKRQLLCRFLEMPERGRDIQRRRKIFIRVSPNNFVIRSEPYKYRLRSNYISYVVRAAEILNSDAVLKQVRNHRRIFDSAVQRHFNDKKMDR